jgi:signal transduction histidine kinase
MFRSIRWHLPFTYALIAFFTVALLGMMLLTHLRSYYAAQEINYLRENAFAISNVFGQILPQYTVTDASGMTRVQYTPTQELQERVNALTFLARVHLRIETADRQQTIIESSIFEGDGPMAIRWSRPVAGATEPLPTGAFSITVGGSQELPQCAEGATCDIVYSETNVVAENQDGPGPGLFVAAMPSLYGYEFGRRGDVMIQARSDQVIEHPIFDPTTFQTIGWVVLSDGPAYGTEIVNGVMQSFILAGTAAVILAALAGLAISGSMSTPLLALAHTTERMANGDLSARVSNITRQDEIGTLAVGFNSMATRIEEMINTLRRFIGDAAHELNTPLTALHTNLELVAAEDISPRARELVGRAQSQLKRLEILTKGLLHLSRIESGSLRENITPVNLTSFTHQTVAAFASQAEQAGVTLDIQLPTTPITLTADESQLQSALGNLLDNAIKFTPEGGVVSIKLTKIEHWAEIRVRDTGIGISSEDIPYLFERFYRGHNVSSYPGSGLGLSIVHAIAEHYGGRIQVLPQTQGTEFKLRLPMKVS